MTKYLPSLKQYKLIVICVFVILALITIGALLSIKMAHEPMREIISGYSFLGGEWGVDCIGVTIAWSGALMLIGTMIYLRKSLKE